MRRIASLIFALLTLPGCLIAPPFYWGEEVHGQVIDADNGTPIEGAVVVADWKLAAGGYGHGGHFHSLVVEQMLTDSNGEFRFDKWGPKMRPAYQALDYGPDLIIFKQGYDHATCDNESFSNGFVRRSECSGRDFRLKRFNGDTEKRLETLDIVLMISALQPLLLKELLSERYLYRSWPPKAVPFFANVEDLLRKRTGQ